MPSFQSGDLVNDRYLLKERIGQGGFSVVWLAEDRQRRNAQVALKIYAPQQGLDERSLDQFEKEYLLTQRLDGPHLLKSTDYFILEGSPYMVFPYMPGGSLANLIEEQKRLPEQEIARMIFQIASGLEYLHHQNPELLHLDVKPENILLSYSQDYILSDFGISVQLRSTLLRASQHVSSGTPMHRAPEGTLSTPSDIFSLGVTTYECCQGLFDAEDFPVAIKVMKGISKPEIDKVTYSKRLEELIFACWNEAPEDRPTATALKNYAGHYLSNKFWPEIAEFKDSAVVAPEEAHTPAPDHRATVAMPKKITILPPKPVAAQGGKKKKAAALKQFAYGWLPSQLNFSKLNPTRRNALIGVAAALVLIFGGYQINRNMKFSAALSSARDNLGQNDLAEAHQHLQRALSISPGNEKALSILNEIKTKAGTLFGAKSVEIDQYLDGKKYEQARSVFTEYHYLGDILPDTFTLKRNHTEHKILMDSGGICMARKDFANAVNYYKKAAQFKSDDETAKLLADAERKERAVRLAPFNKKLIEACLQSDLGKATQALAEGADPNAQGAKDVPAITIAAFKGSLDIVKLLVSKGADPNDRSGAYSFANATYGSPAVAAAGNGQLEVLKFLIETANAGVDMQEYDPNTRANNGWSPLGAAAAKNQIAVMEYLIGKGANVNVRQGIQQKTPLIEASEDGSYGAVSLLLRNGANVNVQNSDGYDAYDRATGDSRERIESLLLQYGASRTIKYENSFVAEKGFKQSSNDKAVWRIAGGNLIGRNKNNDDNTSKTRFFYVDVYKNIEVSTSVKINSYNESTDGCGLVLFDNILHKLVFLISNSREFVIAKQDYFKWSVIKSRTFSSYIQSPSQNYNKLTVKKFGSTLYFYINDNRVYSMNGDEFTGLSFGLNTQGYTEAKFDYFTLTGTKK